MRMSCKILPTDPACGTLELQRNPKRWTNMTEYMEILREAGLRVTQQRMSIIAILTASNDHPSADDVYSKARLLDETVSVATVYRTLAVLESAGMIRKLSFEDAPARFEMMPQSDHDHLNDVDTGELIEIPSGEIDSLRNRLAADLGYEIVSQHTILRGRRKA